MRSSSRANAALFERRTLGSRYAPSFDSEGVARRIIQRIMNGIINWMSDQRRIAGVLLLVLLVSRQPRRMRMHIQFISMH